MEGYLPQTHYEPNGFLNFALDMGSVMFVLLAGFIAAAYGMTSKSSPAPEISMSKTEIRDLVSKAVRDEVKMLEMRMAVRESQLGEALDIAHQHEARIAALEDMVDRGAREMDALRASLNSPKSPSSSSSSSPSPTPSLSFFLSVPPSPATSDTFPATQWTPSPPSEHSSRAHSDHQENSDDDSIYGAEDYKSSPRVSSSPDQAPEVSSPQLDPALEDELAELGGWGLDIEASEDVSDGNITDQDAEGETDDEYEAPAPPIPSAGRQRVLAPRVWDRWEGLPATRHTFDTPG
ncbi:uncharacterized protein J4E78_004108 [Alternaria triticimaculans]|uniref:uncharacterized protein n=1 Tax=Alternaria triticimaculans TaxID=297637 RepID=UPI0020C415D7|nr:uncharacterized protein J4E78_004108 [Alternaria triticimaculans]KAI4663691.1 hypothetical protein J4E78_004108 [Alternaria triticimaculans]